MASSLEWWARPRLSDGIAQGKDRLGCTTPRFAVAAEARKGDADPATTSKPGNVGQHEVVQTISFKSSTHQSKGEPPMALYELRTYTLHVGKMAEAVKLYQEIGSRRSRRAGRTRSWSGISKAIRVRSINLYIFGSSRMTPTVVRIGCVRE